MYNLDVAAFLGWCAVLNYAVLILWFLFFALAHDRLFRLHSLWFDLKVEQFDVINYGGMGLYKLLIFVFNLAPYLVLRLVS
jgi:hypothetical protein